MQMHVNAAIDSDLDHISSEKNPGIKQVREGEGERGHQLGNIKENHMERFFLHGICFIWGGSI